MADSEDERARLDALARALIHRFQSVLAGIQPHAEVIKRAGKNNERILGAATQIEIALRRARSMMSEVSELSRPAALDIEPFEVTGWFDMLRRDVQPLLTNPLQLTFEAAPDLVVSGDREELTRAVVNLVNNAAESMPQGGAIAVTARAVADGIEVAIADDGTGIAEEILPHIFEPLFTTRRNASGLGLAVVQRIVEGHGGTVRIESETGVGTTVTLVVRRP
ncbi:MAG TPA: HAMP domain-containing sensor histidine kinase [Thermoanaerobaculia bacterium]|nr:HAMP domain-containing sensor histidine kinase [Thermoanaerobaculia bacterium]